MPRLTKAELEAADGIELPDLVRPGLRLLLVGINPGRRSGATGFHFGNPRNHLWPALHQSGLTPRLLRPEREASSSSWASAFVPGDAHPEGLDEPDRPGVQAMAPSSRGARSRTAATVAILYLTAGVYAAPENGYAAERFCVAGSVDSAAHQGICRMAKPDQRHKDRRMVEEWDARG